MCRRCVCSSDTGQVNLQHRGDMKKEPSCWTGPGAGGQGRTGGGGGGRWCGSTSSADPPPSAESCSPVSAARSRPQCHPGPAETAEEREYSARGGAKGSFPPHSNKLDGNSLD